MSLAHLIELILDDVTSPQVESPITALLDDRRPLSLDRVQLIAVSSVRGCRTRVRASALVALVGVLTILCYALTGIGGVAGKNRAHAARGR